MRRWDSFVCTEQMFGAPRKLQPFCFTWSVSYVQSTFVMSPCIYLWEQDAENLGWQPGCGYSLNGSLMLPQRTLTGSLPKSRGCLTPWMAASGQPHSKASCFFILFSAGFFLFFGWRLCERPASMCSTQDKRQAPDCVDYLCLSLSSDQLLTASELPVNNLVVTEVGEAGSIEGQACLQWGPHSSVWSDNWWGCSNLFLPV